MKTIKGLPETHWNQLSLGSKIEHLLESSQETGEGWSLDSQGDLQDEKTSGYAVSISDNEYFPNRIVNETSKAVIWLLRLTESLSDVGAKRIVGFWFDEDEGKGYFDLGYNVPNKKLATKIAKSCSQKAIYGYKNKDVIFIGGK